MPSRCFFHSIVDAVAFIGVGTIDNVAFTVRLHRLIVQVKFCQFAPCLAESPEVVGFLHQRQSWQRLLQVRGKGGTIIGRVKQTIYIIEDVFFRNLLAILSLCQDGTSQSLRASCQRREFCFLLCPFDLLDNIRHYGIPYLYSKAVQQMEHLAVLSCGRCL